MDTGAPWRPVMSAAVHRSDYPIARRSAALIGVCALLALGGCNWDTLSATAAPPDGTGSAASAHAYSLHATVSGLSSSGLTLAINSESVTVPSGTSTLMFSKFLPPGLKYSITVVTPPSGETCTIANGNGTIGTANAANVVITCSAQAYALGGSISGLSGSGLVLTNGTDTISVPSGAATFTMPTLIAYTSSYNLTVQTQPVGLACSVSQGTGTMPASARSPILLVVSCTDQPFSLGGSISGLGSQ